MAEEAKNTVFDVLNAVNVNEHKETKDTGKDKLSYLSWTWAWAEVKRRYPEASYEILKFNGLPYVFDENTGYMVYTTVTIEGVTHEMWLPVMDGSNRAMKNSPYEVQTKYNKFTVQPATMFDINKTIMRCLTKNLAMFGLGLYIYAGEDLPEDTEDTDTEPSKATAKKTTATKKVAAPAATQAAPQEAQEKAPESKEKQEAKKAYMELVAYCTEKKLDIKKVVEICKLTKQSTAKEFELALAYMQDLVKKEAEKNGK